MKKKRVKLGTFLYGLVLTAFTVYVLLDAFVIQRSYTVVQDSGTQTQSTTVSSSSDAAEAKVTDNSYDNGSISIQIKTYRQYNTNIYVADITLKDADALKTAFADSTYGKNITETVSEIATQSSSILAINGDYYSARQGYVIRNGTIYRDTSSDGNQQDLVIGKNGTFSIITEGEVTAEKLLKSGAKQVLSFGPALLNKGKIAVESNSEVDKAMRSNPRTAIGQIGKLHYVMVVADGRTSESEGLSLYEMAEFMQGLNVETAYNLDGGGSSTMVFNGTVVNQPTTDGNTISERKVSDIVCIK